MCTTAIEDRDEWRPFCGRLYPEGQVAGDPMVCTIRPHDPRTVKHRNEATGFTWWDLG
jgi:hypothetical protein